jgi:hypothetical protein
MDLDPPRIRVDPFVTSRDPDGRWLVTWPVTNLGAEKLRLVSARHPHSQFRTDETALVGDIPAAATAEITIPVRFAEPSGSVVENPFFILVVSDLHATWRILARVAVRSGPGQEPVAGSPVVVTVNRSGDIPT